MPYGTRIRIYDLHTGKLILGNVHDRTELGSLDAVGRAHQQIEGEVVHGGICGCIRYTRQHAEAEGLVGN